MFYFQNSNSPKILVLYYLMLLESYKVELILQCGINGFVIFTFKTIN